jgi:chlorinating enzyme
MTRLTPDQRAQFDAHGYVAPIDALGADEAADCRRRLEALLAPTGDRADTRVRNSPHLLLRWMADLVRDARVLDPVEDLLGPDLLVLRSTLFVKVPHDPGIVSWHQDLAYWDLSSDRTITAWIALTDSTIANGCLRVVPGSHRAPLLPHTLGRDRNNRLLRGQLVQADIPPERVAALELRPGQFSLHHGRLLHSSPANPSDTLRAGLAVRFISADTRQGGPRHGATLVRGVDAYGHYDHEPAPRVDGDPVAHAWHARALRRYALHVAWQSLRHPSPAHLRLLARLALRPDALRAMFPRIRS